MTGDERIRVQKAISQAGLMSRRAAEALIAEGRVTVDGRPVGLGDRVDPESEQVEVDGDPIPTRPGLCAYLLFKPPGVVSTADDPQGRRTVVDLVPAEPRVWPVGRLDSDSEGLLILTNDGILTHRLTHPSFEVPKTYTVLVEGPSPGSAPSRLTEGVILEDGPARAVSARIVDRRGPRTLLEVVLTEGRNREVRRMCDALGLTVIRLVRTAIGDLSDRSLKPGAWRRLGPAELAALYRAGR
jgi:23S rRNA pseudouridine2605 synthase